MPWILIAPLLYLAAGVGVVIIGERWSQRFEGHDEGRLTVLGGILITVCWPILVSVVIIEWVNARRNR